MKRWGLKSVPPLSCFETALQLNLEPGLGKYLSTKTSANIFSLGWINVLLPMLEKVKPICHLYFQQTILNSQKWKIFMSDTVYQMQHAKRERCYNIQIEHRRKRSSSRQQQWKQIDGNNTGSNVCSENKVRAQRTSKEVKGREVSTLSRHEKRLLVHKQCMIIIVSGCHLKWAEFTGTSYWLSPT